MAGAIAARGKLSGIALGPHLLAARAFDNTAGGAKATSFAIYKSLQWAADNGARVINMSFAGPPDPNLHRMLTAAYDKGIVLVAAAGNAGPKSAPLYPAADPDVIAVTATDSNDGLFNMANRGSYIAVAAPGVDILALAPGELLSGHHGYVGRSRPRQRDRGDAVGRKTVAQARRSPFDHHVNRETAGPRRTAS